MRILVADDHELVRQGIRSVLQERSGWKVMWEVSTGREAVRVATKERPDVNILDLAMPEMDGLEAAKLILQHQPDAQVLILTMYESEQLIRDALDCGVRGYILKSDTGKDLVAAVETLRQHRVFFSSTIASIVLDDYIKVRRGLRQRDSSSHGLTRRECEIVQLLAEGRTNKEISTSLAISVKTVETHRHRIMQKLRLNSIVDLVHYAIRHRLVSSSTPHAVPAPATSFSYTTSSMQNT